MNSDQPEQPGRDAVQQQRAVSPDRQAAHRHQYQRLFESPELLAWQLEAEQGRVLLARMREQTYRDAVFLDQRLNLDGKIDAFWVPIDKLTADFAPRLAQIGDSRFLFHIGHCGSTLISRLLGHSARLLPLREPLSLRSLASAERLLGPSPATWSAAHWREQLHVLLCLFGRSYAPEQRALVKASSNCNQLLPAILGSNAQHRAILLYTNLQTYLASVLRPQSRGALHHFAQEKIIDLQNMCGEQTPRLDTLSPACLGAMNWCTGMAQFLHIAETAAFRSQVKLVNFDDLLQARDAGLGNLFRFLGIEISGKEIETILFGTNYLNTYAKDSGVPYTPELRAEDLAQSLRVHGQEIAEARRWLESLILKAPRLAPLQSWLDQDRGR